MSTKYTPEPWTHTKLCGRPSSNKGPETCIGIIGQGGIAVAWINLNPSQGDKVEDGLADAARIVACVNLLAPHPDLAGVEVVSGETLRFVCDALAVTKDRLIKDGASVAPHGSHKRVALAMLTEALGLLGRGG